MYNVLNNNRRYLSRHAFKLLTNMHIVVNFEGNILETFLVSRNQRTVHEKICKVTDRIIFHNGLID